MKSLSEEHYTDHKNNIITMLAITEHVEFQKDIIIPSVGAQEMSWMTQVKSACCQQE